MELTGSSEISRLLTTRPPDADLVSSRGGGRRDLDGFGHSTDFQAHLDVEPAADAQWQTAAHGFLEAGRLDRHRINAGIQHRDFEEAGVIGGGRLRDVRLGFGDGHARAGDHGALGIECGSGDAASELLRRAKAKAEQKAGENDVKHPCKPEPIHVVALTKEFIFRRGGPQCRWVG